MAEAPSPPEPLSDHHDLSRFSSGEPAIDEWLRSRARIAEGRTARTYVVCDGEAVIGYHAISTGSVERSGVPRALPDPVPIAIIARLGVTATWHGRGLGHDLLGDAIKRIVQAAEVVASGRSWSTPSTTGSPPFIARAVSVIPR
jgi:GNAT superfamily N-acetyltransferase